MAELILEIVEGRGEGRQVPLDRALELGREQGVDLVLDDELVSRRHARIAPQEGGALVEDLGSRNGTFVNGNQLHAPTTLRPGDRLLVGVTVLELRSPEQVRARPTAVVQRPPGLAIVEHPPDYMAPVLETEKLREGTQSELEALLDVRTKAKARAAVLALFVLVALAVMIYLATR